MLRYLFVQDLVASGTITVGKVATVHNLADIFTKYVPAVLNHLLPLCGVRASKSSKSLATYNVNSIHLGSASRMTSPRRTRTSRGSIDRLEWGNNSNINSNVPPSWHQATERLQQRMDRSTSATRIRPR
eukprot:2239618-Amphidinium_carterae.1